jgi:membrane protein implicated in regulation of membrane protease activity
MSGWIVWLVVACAFGVGELVTTGFFLGPFAVGGLLAALTAAAGGGEAAAVVVFVVISVLTLMLIRPIVHSRSMRSSPTLRTGAAGLIGKRAIVLERIANDEGVGCVRIDGEVWTARAYDNGHVIEAGTPVEIIDIRGATALVSE